MKKQITDTFRLIYMIIFVFASAIHSETVVFTKPAYADWSLAENQDRITENIWITRKDIQSIFNIAQEDGYSGENGSPSGTLWADTITQAAEPEGYTNFVAMHGGSPQSLIGDTVSLFLPQSNLYFDVSILSWGGGNTGGDFSYTRTSIGLGVDETITPKEFFVSNNYPNPFNPATAFDYDFPDALPLRVNIFDMNGRAVQEHTWAAEMSERNRFVLNGSDLSSGVYACVFTIGDFQIVRKSTLVK